MNDLCKRVRVIPSSQCNRDPCTTASNKIYNLRNFWPVFILKLWLCHLLTSLNSFFHIC